MDFRLYDNALGRFFGIDALSEKNHYLSPYNFSDGNPVVFSDPSGLDSQYWGPCRRGIGLGWSNCSPHPSDRNDIDFMVNSSGGGGYGSTTPVFNNALELANYTFAHSMPGRNTVWERNWNGSFTATHFANYSVVSQITFTEGAIGADGLAEMNGSHSYVATETSSTPIGGNGGGAYDNWFFNNQYFEAESGIRAGTFVDLTPFKKVLGIKIGEYRENSIRASYYKYKGNISQNENHYFEIALNYVIGASYKYDLGQDKFDTISLSYMGVSLEYSEPNSYQSQLFFGIDTGIGLGWGIGGFADIKGGWLFDL